MGTYVPHRELRDNLAALLLRVEQGEELTITMRGRPIADLVPTREAPGGQRRTGWTAFATGLSGILADDDRFEADVCDALRTDPGPARRS